MTENDSEKKEKKNRRNQKPPALEWLIAAVGLILVAGTIGFLIYQAVTDKNTPPDLLVSTDSVVKTENG